MFKELLHSTIQKLRANEVFKFGTDQITQHSFEIELNYSVDDLRKCLEKSRLYAEAIEVQHREQSEQMAKNLNNTIFNFELIEELKKKMGEETANYQFQISEQQKLQKWLEAAIQQNVGVFIVGDVSFIYDAKSLNIFHHESKFRQAVVWLTEQTQFDMLVILAITFDSFVSIIESSRNNFFQGSKAVEIALQCTNVFYILEATLKIIAQGLYKHKNSYFRNGWNTVDFIVVLSSIYEIVVVNFVQQDSYNINFVRLFRILRPLRSVKRVPSMRRLVSIMLRSLPELVNTLIFMNFFFIVFGIIGIQNFHGAIYQRCRLTEEPVDGLWEIDPTQSHFICSTKEGSFTQCRPGTFCGSPISFTEIQNNGSFMGDEPWKDEVIQYNTINFNNILVAIVSIFEALTLEGWSVQMQFLVDSGNSTFSIIYYILLVIFGSYFILNLILAVIMGSFTKFEKQEIEESINEAELLQQQEELIWKQEAPEQMADNHLDPLKLREMSKTKRRQSIATHVKNNQRNRANSGGVGSDKLSSDLSKMVESLRKSSDLKFESKSGLEGDLKIFKQARPPTESLSSSSSSSSSSSGSSPQSRDTKSIQNEKSSMKDQGTNQTTDVIQEVTQQDLNILMIQDQMQQQQSAEQVIQSQPSIDKSIFSNKSSKKHLEETSFKGEAKEPSEFDISDELNYEKSYDMRQYHQNFFSKLEFDDQFNEGGTPEASNRNDSTIGNLIEPPDIVTRTRTRNDSIQRNTSSSSRVIRHRHSILHVHDHSHGHGHSHSHSHEHHHEHHHHEKKPSPPLKQKLNQSIEKMQKTYHQTRFRLFFFQICQNRVFNIVVLTSILVNTISLSLDRYPIDPKESKILEQINMITTWIYLGELIIKVFGLGIKNYASDSMNQFDAILVIISLVEFILLNQEQDAVQQEKLSLTIFRGFRLLRGLRLFRKWKTFHRMMIKIGQTLKDILIFFILLLIVVFVFSLLGVELFSGKIKVDQDNQIVPQDSDYGYSPQQNFDNFLDAFVSVFVCLIGEDWQLIFHDYERANQSRLIPCIYFITVMIIGHLFLMNLFLAILLKNFEEQKLQGDEAHQENEEPFDLNKSIQFAYKSLKVKLRRVMFKRMDRVENTPEIGDTKDVVEYDGSKHISADHQFEGGDDLVRRKGNRRNTIAKSYIQIMQAQAKKKSLNRQSSKLMDMQNSIMLQGKSLFIFDSENRVRVFLSKLVSHRNFETFIFAVVISSIIFLGLEDPLENPNAKYGQQISIANYIITLIFIFELTVKAIVHGFALQPKSYLRDGWNILDFTIVIISIVSFVLERTLDGSSAGKQLAMLKMLRVLRSLRMISRNEGLKLSVLSLIYSLPGILNVTIVTMLFLLLFGIFFLNLLKGKFYRCIFPAELEEYFTDSDLIDTKYDCVNYGGEWANKFINFDNIPQAFLALYTMSTTEGWVVFMNDAVDARGIGLQPKRGTNPFYKIIFIVYMVFGSLFITNLFIEVVINTFHQKKHQLDRNYLLTKFQKEWIQIQIKCYNAKPESVIDTQSEVRKLSLKIVEHKYFDPFIMLAIGLNTLVLMVVWIGITPGLTELTDLAQGIFNWVFVIECSLKLIAYQRQYFQDGWNIFDFIIVIGGLSGSLIQSGISSQLSVARIIRVCRILRLLKKAKRLYIIFNSFIRTIPAFVNVGGLIMILIYIFAVIGSRLFAKIKLSDPIDERQKNFQTFGNSFLTLVIVMTGEGWYEIMEAFSKQNSMEYECIENPTYEDYAQNDFQTVGCGQIHLSIIFFCSYVFIVSLILLNLFIAVTLQGFNEVSNEDDCRISDYHLQTFISTWKNIDFEGTGFIHISEAPSLLRNLIENKCELFPPNAKVLAYDPALLPQLIQNLQLKLYKKFQYYNFHDILISLSQMYVYYLASRDIEIIDIIDEFIQLNHQDFPPQDLDDVIEHIVQLKRDKNIQLCQELDKVSDKFKLKNMGKIDIFDGNIYNSSMIPVIIKIQQRFREKRMNKIKNKLGEKMKSQMKFKINKASSKAQEVREIHCGSHDSELQQAMDSISVQIEDLLQLEKGNELTPAQSVQLQNLIEMRTGLKEKLHERSMLKAKMNLMNLLDTQGLNAQQINQAIQEYVEKYNQQGSPQKSSIETNEPALIHQHQGPYQSAKVSDKGSDKQVDKQCKYNTQRNQMKKLGQESSVYDSIKPEGQNYTTIKSQMPIKNQTTFQRHRDVQANRVFDSPQIEEIQSP